MKSASALRTVYQIINIAKRSYSATYEEKVAVARGAGRRFKQITKNYLELAFYFEVSIPVHS
jgi:hypothetical protein